MPDFSIAPAVETPVSDQDLEALLKGAYIDGRYTDPSLGEVLFRANNVKARGEVLVAQDPVGTLGTMYSYAEAIGLAADGRGGVARAAGQHRFASEGLRPPLKPATLARRP